MRRMAEHQHGSMDPSEHQKVFQGLIRVAAWVAAISILVLIFLGFVGT